MASGNVFSLWFAGLLLMFFINTAIPSPFDSKMHKIFVTSNGWHTGIVINRKYISAKNIPEIVDVSPAKFVEFGWGDRDFYPAKEHTVDMTLAAALMPTDAVLHVAGLPATPSLFFNHANIIPLWLSKVNLDQLVAFIASSFERKGALRADPIASGLYKSSYFYPATGKFHLMNNCNNWTARGLRASGFKIKLTGVIQAESLIQQIRFLSRK